MTNYRRNRLPGGTYFFTVALFERRSSLLIDKIEHLRSAVRYVRRHHPFEIVAWVVMPDHLHAVWRLPDGDDDYAMRWRLIKTIFSRGQIPLEPRNTSRRSRGERGICQRRYWEHTIRDEQDLQRHIDYIHYNPVKHGYVTQVRNWPYSTFHRYEQYGVYSPDWGVDYVEPAGGFGE